jgi:hypothetical protein
MRRPARIPLTLTLLLALSACGDEGGAAAPKSKDAQAKAVIQDLFRLVQEKKPADAAALIAYRGREDKARRWNAPNDYGNPDEKRAVDAICSRVAGYLAAGAPVFERFQSETESEGEWLVWHVAFGTGEGAKKAAFACIKNGAHCLLGDIDNE